MLDTRAKVKFYERGSRFHEPFASRDGRSWGFAIAVLSWVGQIACLPFDLHGLRLGFVAVNALTWGLAVTTFTSINDNIELVVVSAALSVSFMILIGVAVVELHLTGTMAVAFLCVGLATLVVQALSLKSRILTPTGPHTSDRDEQ